jgi:hypothetical protein
MELNVLPHPLAAGRIKVLLKGLGCGGIVNKHRRAGRPEGDEAGTSVGDGARDA